LCMCYCQARLTRHQLAATKPDEGPTRTPFFRNNSTPLIKVVVCTSRPCPLYYLVSLRAPTLRNSTTALRVP
jgi:hypothetical protein